MTAALGVDSLGFLSVDGLYKAMGETGRNDANPQFTDHCFTGEYPTLLTDHKADRASLHQPAHRLTGERRSAACDRLVHDAQRVAHRAVARLRQHCEGIIIYCNAFAPGDIA